VLAQRLLALADVRIQRRHLLRQRRLGAPRLLALVAELVAALRRRFTLERIAAAAADADESPSAAGLGIFRLRPHADDTR
jgi:hypothetical protein